MEDIPNPQWLQEMLDQITPKDIGKIAITSPVKPTTEEVIGEVPEELQKLFIVYFSLEMAHKLVRRLESRMERSANQQAIAEVAQQKVIVRGLFMVRLRKAMGKHKDARLNVRAGWKVVMPKSERA